VGDDTQTHTLRELIEVRGLNRADDAYLEDARSERTITYAELARSAREWRNFLDRSDIPFGAAVIVDVDDPLTFATSYLGVVAAGRCAIPIDPAMPDAEFERVVTTLQPLAVIGHEHPAFDGLRRCEPELGARPSDGVDHSGSAEGPAGCIRLRTSGSTGEPKIVELTEAQLLHVARAIAAHNELGPGDRGFNPLPLFHINGEVVALLATLVAGATLVVDRRFHRDGFWSLVAAREITWINAVPAILTILSRDPIPARPPRLRFIRSASAPLPAAVRDVITEALGEIVIESYGMTEAASQITATRLGEHPPTASAGRPVGVELQVRDDEGQPVAAGTVGRVWLRGPGVITHYVGGRAAERFDAAGWLDSGDIGRVDADGNLFLAGRTDDVINRGGQLVYPREVEEVLLGDDAVLDAIVVGRPDDILGAVPVAYVIPGPTADDELIAALEQRCREQLSRYKRPASVLLVADLPRAATGKVRRHLVREAAAR
jgi:acyl-CoA synthetase (AMP-forming)/AMP-acid ligase II